MGHINGELQGVTISVAANGAIERFQSYPRQQMLVPRSKVLMEVMISFLTWKLEEVSNSTSEE